MSADGDRAVVFAFQLATPTDDAGPLRPGGLHPNRIYEIVAVDLAGGPDMTRTDVERRRGAALMEEGLEWPLSDPCTARIWMLQSV